MAEWYESDIAEDDPYAQVPKMFRGSVKQMVEGRMAPPAGAALRSPQVQMMIEHANKIDPQFDANTWASRNNSVKDFSAGKSAEMVRALNQTLHHTKELTTAMDALGNYQYPQANWVKNLIDNQVRGKGEVTSFLANAHAVAEEMSKVYKGSNMSDSEIRAWEKTLHPNMSPEQQRAGVGKFMDLLHGGLMALENKRLQAQGKHLVDRSGPLISKEGLAALDHIEQWRQGGAKKEPAAEPAGAPAAGGIPQGWGIEVR